MRSEFASQWKITLTGALVLGGKVITLSFTSWLTEFSGLGDPLILGMPTIDRYGGIESVRRYCWVAGLWIPRFFPPRKIWEKGAVKSLSSTELCVSWDFESYAFQKPRDVDSCGWHLHHTFWDPKAIRAAFQDCLPDESGVAGCRKSEMWLEASPICHPDLEVLNTVVDFSELDLDSDTPLMMSVLIKARSGCSVTVGSSDAVCSLRATDPDCEQALADFRIARLSSESTSATVTGPDNALNRIATSRYRTATRAEDQARLFPALEAEIKARKEQMSMPPIDQTSAGYQAHICATVEAEKLCPTEHLQLRK